MRKLMLLAAAGVGYVLGAKAGRTRYEQLRSNFQKVRNDPRVQEKTQQLADAAAKQAPVVKDKVTSAAASAKERVAERTGSGPSADDALVEQLHPESTARQDDPYPKGDLP